MVIAEENHLFEKHLKNSQDLFKDKRTNKTMNPADFDHEVTMDDIDIEESRELLMDALAEQEYQEKSGMLKTGQPAVDRFIFHRIYEGRRNLFRSIHPNGRFLLQIEKRSHQSIIRFSIYCEYVRIF